MNRWGCPPTLLREPSELPPGVILIAGDRVVGAQGEPALADDPGPDDLYLGHNQQYALWARQAGESPTPHHTAASPDSGPQGLTNPSTTAEGPSPTPDERATVEDRFSWRQACDEWAEPIAAALVLTHWHASHPACEACGSTTLRTEHAHARACHCGHLTFARTDPAIIVAVVDPQDRLLLVRKPGWQESRRSVIAGFVEAGESLEQACWREAREEAGVTLTQVTYCGSEPWPMPRSLMAGFMAHTSDTTAQLVDGELAHAEFLTREQVEHEMAQGRITLPTPSSMGYRLIMGWLRHELSPGKHSG